MLSQLNSHLPRRKQRKSLRLMQRWHQLRLNNKLLSNLNPLTKLLLIRKKKKLLRTMTTRNNHCKPRLRPLRKPDLPKPKPRTMRTRRWTMRRQKKKNRMRNKLTRLTKMRKLIRKSRLRMSKTRLSKILVRNLVSKPNLKLRLSRRQRRSLHPRSRRVLLKKNQQRRSKCLRHLKKKLPKRLLLNPRMQRLPQLNQ